MLAYGTRFACAAVTLARSIRGSDATMLKWARRLVHRLGTGDQASAGQSSSAGQAARGGRTVADPSPGPVGLAAVTARPDDLRAAPDDGSSELHKPRPSGNTQPDVPGAEPRVGTKDQIDFDEEWYLECYADIARAVSEGRCASGLQHYLSHGRIEGRLPVPPDGWVSKRPSMPESGSANGEP